MSKRSGDPWLGLHAVSDARSRILRRLAGRRSPVPLDRMLPNPPEPGAAPESGLRGRSRWTSTLTASLELAKQGDVAVMQEEGFSPIQVGPARGQDVRRA